MRRRVARPYGQTVSPARLLSLLFAAVLLWVFYERAKEPENWRWLAGDAGPQAAAEPAAGPEAVSAPPAPETIVPGPDDRDAREAETVIGLLELVRDRTPLKPGEMAAYWRFMRWARAQPQRDLERRAQSGVPTLQIWEQPGRYRGKPIRLSLHVKRVLHFEAPANPVGVKDVYEIWGWTDDSLSQPYVVVVPELPQGLKVGADVSGEIVFAGYFLKNMAYEAVENHRAAPLLVGRARTTTPSVPARKGPAGGRVPAGLLWAAGLATLAVLGWPILRRLLGLGRSPRRDRISKADSRHAGPADADGPFASQPVSGETDNPFADLGRDR